MHLSAASSSCHGEMREVPVDGCQVTAIIFPAEHSVAEQFPCTSEFFVSSFTPFIHNRQIQKFNGTVDGLLATLLVFSIPTGSACNIAPDIGQIVYERVGMPSSRGELFVSGSILWLYADQFMVTVTVLGKVGFILRSGCARGNATLADEEARPWRNRHLPR